MEWKLSQVFGEDPSSVNEENVITSVEFDRSGEYLSVGYQCGQVVVFRNSSGDTFKFHTQFESHHPEFDFLTSLEIEEKIATMRWVPQKYHNNARMLFTANDKTIKLWKMFQKVPKNASGNAEEGQAGPVTETVCRKVFANAHSYNINSVSLCSDGELFLSADDLRVNLWKMEISSECFTMVDKKPANMNELNEVITSAEFHPREPTTFIYSTSKGEVKMSDMRRSALCDSTIRGYKDKEQPKSFFSEVIASISDVQFSSDGRFILARDYLQLKIWDVAMDAKPVKVIRVHDHIKSKLYELYENDGIFDKFQSSFSPDSTQVVTGSYSNNFAVFDVPTEQAKYMQAVNPRERRKKKSGPLPTTDAINYDEKVLYMSWHPSNNLIAAAAQNYIYLYHLTK